MLSWAECQTLDALGAQRLELSLWGSHGLVIDSGCEFLGKGASGIYEHRLEVCPRSICDEVAQAPAAPPG